MKRQIWIEIICYAFMLLFLYTAIAKLSYYHTSVNDLERSPFIGDFALPLSIVLPASEIIIAVMLFLPKYRMIGLYAAAGLMILFTIYVSALVFTQDSLPCACGGLIKHLTWKQHFFFNIFFTGLAFLGIWLQRNERRTNDMEYSTS